MIREVEALNFKSKEKISGVWVDAGRETAYLTQRLTFHALGCVEDRDREV